MPATAIITMAGFGRRFQDAGYTVPKYRIDVHGRTLFAWSMLSLTSFIADGSAFIFVVRRADEAATFIRREAARLGISEVGLIELDGPTDGQATTALLAGEAVARTNEPILIYNIDTFVHPDALAASAPRGDGWIPCFDGPGDHWSFVGLGSDGRATEVREKVRISAHATVGLYWFSSYNLYREAYAAYYGNGAPLDTSERYCAPLYNNLIGADRSVYISDIPASSVIPLGTPAEVEAFMARKPPILSGGPRVPPTT